MNFIPNGKMLFEDYALGRNFASKYYNYSRLGCLFAG
jgi:hypothetical protein